MLSAPELPAVFSAPRCGRPRRRSAPGPAALNPLPPTKLKALLAGFAVVGVEVVQVEPVKLGLAEVVDHVPHRRGDTAVGRWTYSEPVGAGAAGKLVAASWPNIVSSPSPRDSMLAFDAAELAANVPADLHPLEQRVCRARCQARSHA